ncbi:hypothetical protein M2351_005169 [Azospirillum canadense]|nr:hypothetical protein [Azospirillum canadense]
MERRNSGRPDREVRVSFETSRVGEQCLSDRYEHLLPWRCPYPERAQQPPAMPVGPASALPEREPCSLFVLPSTPVSRPASK